MFTQQTVSVLRIRRLADLTLVLLIAGDSVRNANRLGSAVDQIRWSVLRPVHPDPKISLHRKRVQMPSPAPFLFLEISLAVAADVAGVCRPLKDVATDDKCCRNILCFE